MEDQLRSNQIAADQNSREAKEAVGRNAEVLTKGLQNIQEAFATQQGTLSERNLRELQAMQSFNRVMLVVGGTFTTLASLAIIMVVYFQWRTSKVWAEISTGRAGPHRLNGPFTANAVGPSDLRAVEAGTVGDSNSPLLQAIGQLETRVQELEQTTGLPPQDHDRAGSLPDNGAGSAALGNGGERFDQPETNGQASLAVLLDQGRTRFKANDWEGALKCFDEVLALEPNHSEALVKKGVALERLRKLDEAFTCYDRAIAADDSMTIAYLHKGGLCSRLERFKEALECYEKALRTHAEWGGSH
jgi:tetratricopeptide (TPR) repeat protein